MSTRKNKHGGKQSFKFPLCCTDSLVFAQFPSKIFYKYLLFIRTMRVQVYTAVGKFWLRFTKTRYTWFHAFTSKSACSLLFYICLLELSNIYNNKHKILFNKFSHFCFSSLNFSIKFNVLQNNKSWNFFFCSDCKFRWIAYFAFVQFIVYFKVLKVMWAWIFKEQTTTTTTHRRKME